MDRLAIARTLREIASLLDIEGGNPFRARAYERGARALEALSGDLGQLIGEGRLTTVPGIGPALAETIAELHRSGRSPMLDRLRQRLPPGALELGPVLSLKKIALVHEALGIRTLDELRLAAEAGRLRTVKGFGPRTEQKVLEAIRDLTAAPEDIHLHVATREGDAAVEFVRTLPGAEAVEVAGALRRRCETVDRIVLVAATRREEDLLLCITRYPVVASVLERSDSLLRARLAGGVLLEAHTTAPRLFAAAWHRHTGTEGHRAKLAVVAEARGLRLSDDGLSRDGRRLPVGSEDDLYRHLEIPFIPPEMREDTGEVEAAVRGGLPSRLVEVGDIQGMVHCHTVYSDGRHTIEEMARGAEALGMKYLTITDHSPTAHYAGGLRLDRLERQWDEIAQVQERVKIRLLRGTESDILADGSLDWPAAVLDKLDVIIASIHNRYRMDADQMTRRLLGALRQPQFKIWGHALGRYVLRRPPIPCRMEEVLDAAGEARVAVEINGNPHRLDMEPRWIREALRRGVRFVVSTDAHSIAEMNNLRYGIDMARKGGLTRDDVLNTDSAENFAHAVRP